MAAEAYVLILKACILCEGTNCTGTFRKEAQRVPGSFPGLEFELGPVSLSCVSAAKMGSAMFRLMWQRAKQLAAQ